MGMGGAQAVMEVTLVLMEVGPMVMGVCMIVVGVAVDRAIRVGVFVHVFMGVIMIVGMIVPMGVVMTFDPGFTFAAAAYRAHVRLSEIYSTSRSLTRISVPPVACTW